MKRRTIGLRFAFAACLCVQLIVGCKSRQSSRQEWERYQDWQRVESARMERRSVDGVDFRGWLPPPPKPKGTPPNEDYVGGLDRIRLGP
jgi:hypothetical protein